MLKLKCNDLFVYYDLVFMSASSYMKKKMKIIPVKSNIHLYNLASKVKVCIALIIIAIFRI